MVVDQGEKRTKERCLLCMMWHEPDQHTDPKAAPEVLTGQVPVSGNLDDPYDPDQSMNDPYDS
jgi:hypothetical protein